MNNDDNDATSFLNSWSQRSEAQELLHLATSQGRSVDRTRWNDLASSSPAAPVALARDRPIYALRRPRAARRARIPPPQEATASARRAESDRRQLEAATLARTTSTEAATSRHDAALGRLRARGLTPALNAAGEIVGRTVPAPRPTTDLSVSRSETRGERRAGGDASASGITDLPLDGLPRDPGQLQRPGEETEHSYRSVEPPHHERNWRVRGERTNTHGTGAVPRSPAPQVQRAASRIGAPAPGTRAALRDYYQPPPELPGTNETPVSTNLNSLVPASGRPIRPPGLPELPGIGLMLATQAFEALDSCILYWGVTGEHSALTISDVLRAKKRGDFGKVRKNLISIKSGFGGPLSDPIPPDVRTMSNPRGQALTAAIALKPHVRMARTVRYISQVRKATQVWEQYRSPLLDAFVEKYRIERSLGGHITEEEAILELYPKGLPCLDPGGYILPKFTQIPRNESYSKLAWRAILAYCQWAEKNHPQSYPNVEAFALSYKHVCENAFYGNGGNSSRIGRLEYSNANHEEAMLFPMPTKEAIVNALDTLAPMQPLPASFRLTNNPLNWLSQTPLTYSTIDNNGVIIQAEVVLPRFNPKADPGFPWNHALKIDTCIADVTYFGRFFEDVELLVEGHMTIHELELKYATGRLYKAKGKKEAYGKDKMGRTRIVTVPSPLHLGGQWLVQAGGVRKWNYMNHPTSRTLYGVNFMKGGMHTLLTKLTHEVDTVGFSMLFYADNCFIAFREQSELVFLSFDGRSQECSTNAEKMRMGFRRYVARSFDCETDTDGRPIPNDRINAAWVYYLSELLPTWGASSSIVMDTAQIACDYLNSGIPATFRANEDTMAVAAMEVQRILSSQVESRSVGFWVDSSGEKLIPTRACSDAFGKGQVLPRPERLAIGETGIDHAWDNPIRLLSDNNSDYGVADLDLLGNSAVAIEIDGEQRWVGVLDRARMMKAIVLRKSNIDAIENVLVRHATSLFIYCTLYMVGGFMPEFANGLRSIMLTILSDFHEAGGKDVLRESLRYEAETEAAEVLGALGLSEQEIKTLGGSMAEHLIKGLPTLETVLRVQCETTFVEHYITTVHAKIPNSLWPNLLIGQGDIEKFPVPGLEIGEMQAGISGAQLVHPSAPTKTRMPVAPSTIRPTQLQPARGQLASAQRNPRSGQPSGPNSDIDLKDVMAELHHALSSGEKITIPTYVPDLQDMERWKDLPYENSTMIRALKAISNKRNVRLATLLKHALPVLKQVPIENIEFL